MVGKLDDLEPERRTDEAAASVFREVLGHRPGYARGLGEMVIPESTRQRDREPEKEYLALIEKQKKDVDQYKKDAEQYKEDAEQYRKDADSYKTQLDAMNNEMRVLRERQNEYDKMLREFFQHMPSYTESLQSRGETQ